MYQTVDQKIHQIDYSDNIEEIELFDRKIKKIIKINGLSNLQRLHLAFNRITHIEGLESLATLKELDLSYNQITRIEGLDNLTALQVLCLSENPITCIEGLDNLSDLQCLWLSRNQIIHIEGLNNLTNLQHLNLSCNQITRIEGLDNLTALQKLYIHNNPIKEVPMTIMLSRNLSLFLVDAKKDPIIQRFLSKNLIKSNRTVYDDRQNVHDRQINQSITQSLYRLMEQKSELSEEEVNGEIVGDMILTKHVKEQIIEYVQITDVHSSLNVTFSEALRSVWQVIRKHSESDEIKRILNQEIDDSYCKCFTGRLSRLVNSLNGFDPRVAVRISDHQEIANLIISIRQKTESLAEQTEMVRREMSERGYDGKTIKEWIGYLE